MHVIFKLDFLEKILFYFFLIFFFFFFLIRNYLVPVKEYGKNKKLSWHEKFSPISMLITTLDIVLIDNEFLEMGETIAACVW